MSVKKFYPCHEEREGYVKLGDGFYFTADDNQYILCRLGRKNKTDRRTRQVLDEIVEFEEVLGYYKTLQGLIMDSMEYKLRQDVLAGTIKNMRDVVKKIETCQKFIEQITKGY